jgi:Na+-driven multidrug efflux pump
MNDLTTGSLTRHLLQTTSYMLVTMLFQTLYVLVDLYWGRAARDRGCCGGRHQWQPALHRAGGDADARGSGPPRWLPMRLAGAILSGRTWFSIRRSCCPHLSALIFLVLALALMRGYAAALSADALTRDLAVQYLGWFIASQALSFPFVAMGAALRGTGNFRPGMIVQTSTVILNIILAPVLIFGWGPAPVMGVSGAALATFLAIVIGPSG